jgi:hypothetical protein
MGKIREFHYNNHPSASPQCHPLRSYMWLNPVGTAILDFNVSDSLKTGILHRFGFSQYKNYCQNSPTLGKIKEFYK